MKLTPYESVKARYDIVKPIRGKPHIRPLGDRRKHHETVELFNEQEQIYSYKLYDTHVLLFYPNGDIGVNVDHKAHHTQTTCKFVDDLAQGILRAFRHNNRMWVALCGVSVIWDSGRQTPYCFPMPDQGEITFRQTEDGWRPIAPVIAQNKVVNRQRAKEARDPYREFIKFGKTILTLSDGWIMPETMAQYQTYEMMPRYSGLPRAGFDHSRLWRVNMTDMLEYIQEDPLEVLVYLVDRMEGANYKEVPFDTGIGYAKQVTPKQFGAHVMRLIDRASDIHDYVHVQATGEFIRSYV